MQPEPLTPGGLYDLVRAYCQMLYIDLVRAYCYTIAWVLVTVGTYLQ